MYRLVGRKTCGGDRGCPFPYGRRQRASLESKMPCVAVRGSVQAEVGFMVAHRGDISVSRSLVRKECIEWLMKELRVREWIIVRDFGTTR